MRSNNGIGPNLEYTKNEEHLKAGLVHLCKNQGLLN